MKIGWPNRALWLPTLAILLPSIFVAVLASRWLALERETARLRGSEAAAASLTMLRTDLLAAFASSDRSLVKETFVFDEARRLIGPPAIVEEAEATVELSRRAAALLAEGAEALLAGKLAEASRAASTILSCCAHVRDEFEVSYALYASSQLAAIGRRRADLPQHAIIQRLRTVVDRGLLNRPGDVIGIRAFVETLAGAPGSGMLVSVTEQKVAEAERRRQMARLAEGWIKTAAPVATADGALVAPWPSSDRPMIAALLSGNAGAEVRVIDPDALSHWVSRWSRTDSAFAFAILPEPGAADGTMALRAALFAEVPALMVGSRQRVDPVADRQRERLFLTAAAAVLALTLVAAGLAARDIVRERRMAALRSTFLAGVSHEIKTPITSIRLLAETLQQRRASREASDHLLGTIVNEAEHLSDLVDNVLSTSRIESGTRTYHQQVVSLVDVIRGARQRFDYIATKQGFILEEAYPTAPVWVQADSEALQQAVLNLLGNALKYSGDARVIRLRVEAESDRALIRVADGGVGVPAAERSRIFGSFYRTSEASRLTTGTGLGLALVRHFAEAHGGTVAVASNRGRGSVFTIELPRCHAPLASADPQPDLQSTHHDSATLTHG